jgi:hypothetical protein
MISIIFLGGGQTKPYTVVSGNKIARGRLNYLAVKL